MNKVHTVHDQAVEVIAGLLWSLPDYSRIEARDDLRRKGIFVRKGALLERIKFSAFDATWIINDAWDSIDSAVVGA